MSTTTSPPVQRRDEAMNARGSRFPQRKLKKNNKRPASTTYILILLLTVFFIGPFLWLVLAALKTPAEWSSLPITILPAEPQWENFVHALTDMNFLGYAGNSLILATIYSTLITLSSAAVGFGFARLRAPGKGA